MTDGSKTDVPDWQALARRYLDLWQDRMASMAADPGLAAAMAQAMTEMGQTAAAFAAAAQASAQAHQTSAANRAEAPAREAAAAPRNTAQKTPGGPGGPSDSQNLSAATQRPASVDPASVERSGDVDDLRRRIEFLERRLADVEPATGASRAVGAGDSDPQGSGPPAKGRRKRRPTPDKTPPGKSPSGS